MGGHRLQRVSGAALPAGLLVWVILCLPLCGWAADRNGNFEQTVGGDIAFLAKQQHFEGRVFERVALQRAGSEKARAAAAECELCVPPGTQLRLRDDRNSLEQRLRSQYRQIGESLAAKLWDDPQGRRIKFDIEGKPGLGLVIPFD